MDNTKNFEHSQKEQFNKKPKKQAKKNSTPATDHTSSMENDIILTTAEMIDFSEGADSYR